VVTKGQSSKWQKLAEMDEESFEDRVETVKREAGASTEMAARERQEAKREAREAELGSGQQAGVATVIQPRCGKVVPDSFPRMSQTRRLAKKSKVPWRSRRDRIARVRRARPIASS
jgi:hypothetical protein